MTYLASFIRLNPKKADKIQKIYSHRELLTLQRNCNATATRRAILVWQIAASMKPHPGKFQEKKE